MSTSDGNLGQGYLAEAREQLSKATGVIRHCLGQLSDEQAQWRPRESMNSVGNLVLHLCGNLRQWVISGVGGEPDVRNRPQEFAQRGPFRTKDLLRQLDEVTQRADAVLRAVPPRQLLERRRIQGSETTGLSAIYDSVAHFKGHAQEIVFLTRLQLADEYRFQWVPSTPEEGAPPT